MYAIDSLKQLSVKFMHISELSHFQGQRDFLEPFEIIYVNHKASPADIKELILCCLQYICQSCSQHIKSGWK